MKIVQIDGIKGLITTVFIGTCLFAGFVLFPGFCAMHLWNKYLAIEYTFPTLSLFQGVLLWGICAVSYCILTKNQFAVSFKETPELSDEELDKIIRSAKTASKFPIMNNVIKKPAKIDLQKKLSEQEQSFVSSPITSTKINSNEKEETEEQTSEIIK